MTVRTIRPEELKQYCALGEDEWLEDVIAGLWKGKEGRCRPEWCFLLEDRDKPVGRVFFYHLPSSPDSLILFGLCLDWEGDWRSAGRELLRPALSRMKETGAIRVERHFYDIYSTAKDKEPLVYEDAGFKPIQEKLRFVWKVSGEPVEVPDRLTFTPMTETGEAAFLDAIRRVSVATLDREDQDTVREFGPEEHALRFLAILKDSGFRADRFQLAFLPDGTLGGLVAPSRFGDEKEGAINYIGVVPEQRGRGFGLDLVLKAHAVLQAEGCRLVVSEIDTENRALAAHLTEAGCVHRGTMTWYRRDLRDHGESGKERG
jgi:GNAT superfamily N-acetyltransferase